MKAISSLKLLFLLPLTLILIVAVAVLYTSLSRLERQHDRADLEQHHDLGVIADAAEFSRRLGIIQKRMNVAMDGAISAELNELQLYRIHSTIVNELDSLSHVLKQLSTSELVLDANHGSAQGLQNAFAEYQRFVIMSTDVLAVDPQIANSFLQQAQRHYLDFSMFTSRSEFLLAERAQLRSSEQA